MIAYCVEIATSVVSLPMVAFSIFCAVALVSFVPDRRMENVMAESGKTSE